MLNVIFEEFKSYLDLLDNSNHYALDGSERTLNSRQLVEFTNKCREWRDFINDTNLSINIKNEFHGKLNDLFIKKDFRFETLLPIYNSLLNIERILKKQDSNQRQNQKSISLKNLKKIFVSHSSKDRDIVAEVIDILELIGLNKERIFCSSYEGYGVQLGEDFLERIKCELSEDVLVLFIISDNFYNSPICLCEMGATWIKTNEHIPILVPPLHFKDIKGVIPHTQGFLINDKLKINEFKEFICKTFSITKAVSITEWELKRNRIIDRINKIIA